MSYKISDSMHAPDNKESERNKVRKPVAKPAAVKPVSKKAAARPEAAQEPTPQQAQPSKAEKNEGKKTIWLPRILWVISGAMVVIMALVVAQFFNVPGKPAKPTLPATTAEAPLEVMLPDYHPVNSEMLKRLAEPKTIIPERPNVKATSYEVQSLDSVFGIANIFHLKPESILWANYDSLKGDPQTISVGLTLTIPPTDGVYYKWQEGDTLEGVAGKYHVDPSVILNYPGNNLDLTDPIIQPGQYVMIEGGKGELKTWVVPIPYAPSSGRSKGVSNQCTINPGYPYATGSFIWPTANRSISGNDFWSGHQGIDIGGYTGDAVFASDSGVVVFAGGMSGGYGNVIMIEHDWMDGSVWHTVYAHLSSIQVSCGQSVYQGRVIGAVGSTGNSTGPHLHFEIRQNGASINPHHVLQ